MGGGGSMGGLFSNLFGGAGGGGSTSFSFSSSSMGSGMSVSQETRWVNGRPVTRTVRRYPDGRVETTESAAEAGGRGGREPLAQRSSYQGSNFVSGAWRLVEIHREFLLEAGTQLGSRRVAAGSSAWQQAQARGPRPL
jgi:hypothetical protein